MSTSESDEETTFKYGTPLEPYEEDEVPTKKRYQIDAEQHAVDAQGRRRFHGAFTGGFTAGFGNTVGTPEGWTPSSFKSSRSDKAKLGNHRPEDFMDEEDRSEFGIAPRLLQTNKEFAGQKRAHQAKRFHDGPIPGVPVLDELLRPVHDTVAVKILKAMGWKPGQGAGERMTSKQKKKIKESRKVYGCSLPPELDPKSSERSQENSSSDSEFEYETLFAPDDYEPYFVNRKNDVFGLGYSGLSRHSVLGNMIGEYGSNNSMSHLKLKDKGKKLSIRGQAFGVGALEDDDEDIYSKEDMSHYDFTLGGPENEPVKPKSKSHSSNALEGFVKAKRQSPPPNRYPPPTLPRGYRPTAANRSRFDSAPGTTRDQGLGRHELSADARGNLLGETKIKPIQKPPEPTTTGPIEIIDKTKPLPTIDQNLDYIPLTSKNNTKTDLKTFKPFISDPKKQFRYEKYLKGEFSVLEGDGDRLNEWERDRERVEFEQASKLYKPLTGFMEDRFTHAQEPDDAINPLTVVAKSQTNIGQATKEQIEAASKNLFGPLTRTIKEWRPENLVCKRFNVPDPFGSREPKISEKPTTSYSIFDCLDAPMHDKESFTREQSKFCGSKSIISQPKPKEKDIIIKPPKTTEIEPENSNPNKRMTVAELFMKEFEKDSQKLEKDKDDIVDTINKFDKMELYKSIFLSDDESDKEEVREKEFIFEDFIDIPKNVERNTSPPKGIFANLNFDELNSWNRDSVNEKEVKESEKPLKESNNDITVLDEAMYGPKLPDNFKKKESSHMDISVNFKPKFVSKIDRNKDESSSSDSWVDAKEANSSKKKKKKHKHKKKSKHKSKHKKKYD